MLETVLAVIAVGLALLALVFRQRQIEALALAVLILGVLHLV
jgi:hypothetical protein